VTIVVADRGTPNPDATPFCFIDPDTGWLTIGSAPGYDACNAKQDFDTDVFYMQ
jgi:hypothetical protein